MKNRLKPYFLAVILLGLIALGAKYSGQVFTSIFIVNKGVTATPVTATTAALTLYVETTGSDSNDCITASTPCLTIQEAVDRVPKIIRHEVLIDIGEGNFAAFSVTGFFFAIRGSTVTIQGTLNNPTLTTGTVSGTATGGNTRQLIDAGQAWTVNELRGMLVLVDSQYRIVRNNDATTINFAGAYSATCDGKAYEIFEQKTVINSGTGISGFGRIEINGCTGSSELHLDDIKVDATGITMGVYVLYSDVGVYVGTLHILEGVYGYAQQEVAGHALDMQNTYITGASNSGIALLRNRTTRKINDCYLYNNVVGMDVAQGYVDIDEIYADNNTSHGLKFHGGAIIDIDYAGIDSNGGYGIYLDENSVGNRQALTSISAAGTFDISNNTLGGIIGKNHSILSLTNMDGAGNTGYGLTLETGSYAVITTDTGITGTTDDATINDGTTDLSWATDFAADRDLVINNDNLCVIERKD